MRLLTSADVLAAIAGQVVVRALFFREQSWDDHWIKGVIGTIACLLLMAAIRAVISQRNP